MYSCLSHLPPQGWVLENTVYENIEVFIVLNVCLTEIIIYSFCWEHLLIEQLCHCKVLCLEGWIFLFMQYVLFVKL